jgi:hypothetical protein
MITLDELEEGDTIIATISHQDCLVKGGRYTVYRKGHEFPHVRCKKGTHCIDIDVGVDGYLKGWEKAK